MGNSDHSGDHTDEILRQAEETKEANRNPGHTRNQPLQFTQLFTIIYYLPHTVNM